MSGHSHWATIKRQKEKQDSAKGKIFGKVSREIIFAIQKGNGVTDPNNNVYLRAALEKAKEYNVPKDNVQRLLDKNEAKAARLQEVYYEAFGPENSALVIKCVTDNTNRTLSEVRFLCTKHEGKMGTPNSALFLFSRVGEFILKNAPSEDDALACIDAMGATDFDVEDGEYRVTVPYEALSQAVSAARERGFDVTPQLMYVPQGEITISERGVSRLKELIDGLLDMDDVQDVYCNVSL